MKFTTERDNFADAVQWVSRTVSTRPTLPVLGGALLELSGDSLRLASTDLEHTGEAVVQVRGGADGRVVVPGRIFGDVIRNLPAGVVEIEAGDGGLAVRCGSTSHELRLLDAEDFPTLTQPSLEHAAAVEVAIEPHQVTFAGGGWRLTSRLVEGDFPPFRSLIPSGYENLATVERQPLLDALKQVAPYGQNNNPVRLSFERDRLQVDGSLQDVGRGAAAIDVKYEGEALTIAFNPTYLSEGASAVADNEIVFEIRDGLKPALVHGNDPRGFMYLIMPVRLPA